MTSLSHTTPKRSSRAGVFVMAHQCKCHRRRSSARTSQFSGKITVSASESSAVLEHNLDLNAAVGREKLPVFKSTRSSKVAHALLAQPERAGVPTVVPYEEYAARPPACIGYICSTSP
jgi:hypothetical protein